METMRLGPPIGRNDLCRCGSGKKYKKCCLSLSQPTPTYYVTPTRPPRPQSRNGTTPKKSVGDSSRTGLEGLPEYFFVRDKGWTHKNELKPGDQCKVKDGEWAIFRPDLMNGNSVYVKDKGWTPESELMPGDQYELDGVWLTFQPERAIETTPEHPFYVQGKGWTPAGQIEEGDMVRTVDGWVSIQSVKDTGRWETVYNVRVADFHTYFVGTPEWGFGVWAHNACVVPLDAAEMAANPGMKFKVVDGNNVTYFANKIDAYLVANPITGATNPGAALRQAYDAVNQSGLSVSEKAALLRQYIRQIENQFGASHNWQLALEVTGTDGSTIFSGQAGEAVVVSPNGQIFTGSIRPGSNGFIWGPNGELTPVYGNLKPR